MRKILGVMIIFLLMLSIGCSYSSGSAEKFSLENVLPIQTVVTPEEERGLTFLQEKMTDSNHIIFSSLINGSPNTYSLSESMGQAMEYAALRGDAANFKLMEQAANKYFFKQEGYYAWKLERADSKSASTSALVDDLRIFKAYYLAQENNIGDYRDVMRRLSKEIHTVGVTDGYLCEYYDGDSKTKSKEIPLFYLDVQALNMLYKTSESDWRRPMETAYELLRQMPEHFFGFYPATYKLQTKRYVWREKINMVENLYTAINLKHAGGDGTVFVNFLKGQIKKNKCIYNGYDLAGTPADRNESAAVYALAARLFAMYGETEAAKWCYTKVSYFQLGADNTFSGGFGDAKTKTFYAFDQLEALLMMRMVAKGQ